MPEIRALIVDDEPPARRGLRQLLASYPDISVIGECRDGLEALQMLASSKPDLVFLDVQMPGLDGFGVIRAHGIDRMPITVFVTAYDDFAVRAFETHALDYLVKPLSETRFRATIERVRASVRAHDAVALARRLSALLDGDRPLAAAPDETAGPAIRVPTANGERLIEPDEIDWVEARDDYVGVHCGRAYYLLRESMASFESRLDPAHFLRIHRSALVRLGHVREWKTGPAGTNARLLLRDGAELPISRRRLAHVKARLRAHTLHG